MTCNYRYYDEEEPLDNIRMKIYSCNTADTEDDCEDPCQSPCTCDDSVQCGPAVIIRDVRWLECDPKFII